MLKRQMLTWAVAAVALATATTTVHAADLYWQGNAGDLGGANYFEPVSTTSNLTPGSSDALYIGADGVASQTAGDLTVGRIVVGHNGNSTAGAPGAFAGAGTVQINGGTLTTTLAATGGNVDAGLLIGHSASGTFLINAATVNVQDTVNVGYSSTDPTVTGTLAITGGGSLNVNNGILALGVNGAASAAGAGGNLTVDGNLSVVASGADLVVGVWNKSSFTQTSGTTTIADETFVGRRNADGSSFTLSGGTFNTKNFTVADGTASQGRTDDTVVTVTNATLNVSSAFNAGQGGSRRTSVTFGQGANVTISGSTGIGNGNAANAALNVSGNAVVNFAGVTFGGGGTANFGDAPNNTSFNISDTADVNVSGNVFLGRSKSTNTTLNMTGGTLDVGNLFLMGTGTLDSTGTTTSSPTGIVANHSGGTITSTSNFILCDAGGATTYNLSGTGTIVANGRLIVGRQRAAAVMNQTGGTVNANYGVHVGEAQTTNSAVFGTGTYNVSGGSILATVPEGSTENALAVAKNGTGTFHVIGGDASITVTGNMLVNTTPAVDPAPAFVGTLAYTLEAGESLTEINVTGTATFATGSILSLDLNGTTPSQTSFDLLTAADIVDNGLSFTAPTGWNFQIVSGGNGEILQAFASATVHHPGDTNNDGTVDLTDLNNVLNNFGSTGSGNPGDDDSSGTVDLTDLNNVLNNFGTTYAAAALNVVPEPASLSLLGLGAAALLGRRRRSR